MSPSTRTLSCYGTNLPLRLFYPFLLLFIHHLLSYTILSILLILFVSFIIYALAAPARRSRRFPVDRCQSHVSPPVVPLAQPAVLSPPLRGFGRVVPFALRAFFFASSCCFAPSTGGPRSSAEAPQAITPFSLLNALGTVLNRTHRSCYIYTCPPPVVRLVQHVPLPPVCVPPPSGKQSPLGWERVTAERDRPGATLQVRGRLTVRCDGPLRRATDLGA
jgi:hypothetical protein